MNPPLALASFRVALLSNGVVCVSLQYAWKSSKPKMLALAPVSASKLTIFPFTLQGMGPSPMEFKELGSDMVVLGVLTDMTDDALRHVISVIGAVT